MVKFTSKMAVLLPWYVAESSYVFLDSKQDIQGFTGSVDDYVGNLADEVRPAAGPLRMLSSANRPGAPVMSPTEKKLDFLEKLIAYFQPESTQSPARFINYGCWCFNNELDITKGHGHPLDKVDETCRSHSYCYQCTKMAYDCSVYNGYKYFGRESVNGTRSIECLNDEFGTAEEQCRHTLCECDKRLAEQLARHENAWSAENLNYNQEDCKGKASSQGSENVRFSNGNGMASQGPLRLSGQQVAPVYDEPTSQEDLEQFYQDNYPEDYYPDIYDSSNEFLSQQYDNSDSSDPNTNDLRNLFAAPASNTGGNQAARPVLHHQIPSSSQNSVVNEHECCGDAPTWFPYSTAQGRRACCNGKTYDTSILSCCEDGSLRSSC